ncbi:MAG: hypothetical protein IT478_12410, partial [Xanthomonadales bacterium]|nr:hypothetical protein [Xanthomonadales bacterium]
GGIARADPRRRLIELRAFYNHVRMHQHIDARTPAEAWTGIAKQHGAHGEFFSIWHGELSGWYFPMRE